MSPNIISLHKRNGLYFIKDQYIEKIHFLSMKRLIIIMILMSTKQYYSNKVTTNILLDIMFLIKWKLYHYN